MKRRLVVALSACVVVTSIIPVAFASSNTTRPASSVAKVLENAQPGQTYTAAELGLRPIPNNFNPLIASDQELAQYGLPSRPSNQADLKQWTYLMEHVKHFINPNIEILHSHTVPHLSSDYLGNQVSQNWSGLYDTWTQPFNGVEGYWTVPSVSTSEPGAYSCTWVGLGGIGTPLIQIGTEQDALYSGDSYYAWFELTAVKNLQSEISDFPIHPGDQMYAYVKYLPGFGETAFYLEDITQGNAVSVPTFVTSADVSGATAEWIVERTGQVSSSGSVTYPFLADFQHVIFTGAEAYTGSNPWYAAEDFYDYTETMHETTSSTSTQLTSETRNSTTQFTDTWLNYGSPISPG